MQETRPEVQSKLSALLIVPIQRVPRYKLLLTSLFNLTSPSEDDYNILSGIKKKLFRTYVKILILLINNNNFYRISIKGRKRRRPHQQTNQRTRKQSTLNRATTLPTKRRAQRHHPRPKPNKRRHPFKTHPQI